ncbi:MAG: glycerophosphodiester phosphodiesterase [Chloroflexi bacterium]|nr:glycerophosphodiester phosphodiesterase [Chloroflexota bacterium]
MVTAFRHKEGVTPQVRPRLSLEATRPPLVVAHRGACRLAPENSVAAVDLAIRLGADMVEFDVRRTRDGALVVHHDATLGACRLADLTYDELGRVAGHTPDRLEAILRVAAGRVLLDVELKEEGDEEAVVEVLARYTSPADLIVTSFSARSVAAVKRLGVRAGLLCEWEADREAVFARAHGCGADLIAPHVRLADDAFVRQASLRDVPLLVWTVNDARRIGRYLARPSVMGVITDVPDRALAVRDAVGGQPTVTMR